EHGRPRALRSRDRAPALQGVQGRLPDVHPRGGDRAALLPRQPRAADGAGGGRAQLDRARAAGRLGVGHVPPEPLRGLGPHRDVQGRQHRGAPQEGRPL
ncbi:MAG: Protein often found in Actinomycetes clustered with signal peptidase and/or RNaseHII, partial [uncultured Acidimicrobiales bacterium]